VNPGPRRRCGDSADRIGYSSAMLALLALVHSAQASCALARERTEDGVNVTVTALAEPVRCRQVALRSTSGTLELRATLVDPWGRRRKLRRDHLARLPGGGWSVDAPELLPGGRLELRVGVTGDDLTIALGDVPPPAPESARGRVERTLEMRLDPKDPSYGFVLPRLARTRHDVRWTLEADSPAVEIPAGPESLLLLSEGATPAPGGWTLAPGTNGAAAWEEPGAQALGDVQLSPGSFTLRGPGVRFAVTPPPGATVRETPGEVHVEAPAGGRLRWRVLDVAGAPVISEVRRYLEGLDWRFARVSLPEPAVPTRLHGVSDRQELLEALLAEVQALRDGRLPPAAPLHPRPLSRAWRSGWATANERALILHRMLGQEKFPVRWVLTGRDPDPHTFVGFDRLLLVLEEAGRATWLDPSCRTCRVGEVSPDLVGQPILGSPGRVPAPQGALRRKMALVGEDFVVGVRASGFAATWLREAVAREEQALVERRLLERLGMMDAHLVELSGLEDPGSDLLLKAHTRRAPPSLAKLAPVWQGAREDVPSMDPESPTE
jgi:hypothetical protein